MTLDSKINRFMSEMREQGVGERRAAPPLIRLLWKLRLDVAPPAYWRPWVMEVLPLILGGISMVLIDVLLLGKSWQEAILFMCFFVVTMWLGIWYFRAPSQRLRLSPWWNLASVDE